MNEVGDMEGVLRELVFSQLALVEIIDEQTNCAMEGIRTTGETSGRTCKSRQIVSEFGIVAFDGIGVGLTF